MHLHLYAKFCLDVVVLRITDTQRHSNRFKKPKGNVEYLHLAECILQRRMLNFVLSRETSKRTHALRKLMSALILGFGVNLHVFYLTCHTTLPSFLSRI